MAKSASFLADQKTDSPRILENGTVATWGHPVYGGDYNLPSLQQERPGFQGNERQLD